MTAVKIGEKYATFQQYLQVKPQKGYIYISKELKLLKNLKIDKKLEEILKLLKIKAACNAPKVCTIYRQATPLDLKGLSILNFTTEHLKDARKHTFKICSKSNTHFYLAKAKSRFYQLFSKL